MVLNSRAEFNRCFIPRLTIIEDEVVEKMEEEEDRINMEIKEDIEKDLDTWEKERIRIRKEDMKDDLLKSRKQEKRPKEESGPRRKSKKLRYEKMEDDWGEGRRPDEDQEHQEVSRTQEWSAENNKNGIAMNRNDRRSCNAALPAKSKMANRGP